MADGMYERPGRLNFIMDPGMGLFLRRLGFHDGGKRFRVETRPAD
jgi:hypothetical protein